MIIEHQHLVRNRFQIIGQKVTESGGQSGIALWLLGSAGLILESSEGGGTSGLGIMESILNGAFEKSDSASDENCFWLLDQRLAADWISIASLMDETNSESSDLAIYSLGLGDSVASSNSAFSIVRLNASLARRILDNLEARQDLADYGWAAAIAALGNNVSVLEWGKHEQFRRFFPPDFPNCANPEVAPGIHFPVLDPAIHEAICSLNLDLAERLGSRVLRYNGNMARGWFVEDVERWRHWFGRQEPTRVLEISASDGIGTNAMLDLLFPHAESEVHTIHRGEEVPEAAETLEHFTANAAAGGHTGQVHLYTGLPVEVLAWMIATDGYWESFDFIHFKPMPNYVETMTAVGQAWILLKPGGVMLLDSGMARIGESHPAKLVLETCARVIGNQADPLLTGDLIALKKRPPVAAGVVEGEMKP